MIVTDLNYSLENRLIEKLDLMIARCVQLQPRRDSALMVEGAEGEGKTNSSIAISYYVKSKTNREICLYFRLKALIDFAKSTTDKIIIWDEPALDALSTDWYKKANKDMARLLMVCRKNRHFFLFNFTKFYKFSEYLVVDRSLGMVHMYSRNEITPGRFVYIKKGNLEELYNTYRFQKKRLYKKLMSFRGSFVEVLEKHKGKPNEYFKHMDITIEGKQHCTFEDYDRLKYEAMQTIGDKEEVEDNPFKEELYKMKFKVSQLKFPITTKEDFAKQWGISTRSLQIWAKTSKKMLKDGKIEPENPHIYNNSGLIPENKTTIQKDILIEEIEDYNEELNE